MTVGLYKRPDTFSTLVDSIIFSTARVRLLWIVCNGSPYLELFRAKDHDLAALHAPRTDVAAAAAVASIVSILGVEHAFVAGDLHIFELDAWLNIESSAAATPVRF